MLIISYNNYPSLYIYYNLTDNSVKKLQLPLRKCISGNSDIEVVSKHSDSHIICDLCIVENQESYEIPFSCYMMRNSSKGKRGDPTDFSKIKIPLLMLSLFIMFYFGISRNKATANTKQSIY